MTTYQKHSEEAAPTMTSCTMTFSSELDRAIATYGPDTVFALFDDEPLTYGTLRGNTRTVANALIDLGVRPGDRVGLYGLNSSRWLDFWLAAPLTGARAVPVNVAFRGAFLEQQLAEPRVNVLFVDAGLLSLVADIAETLSDLHTLVVHGEIPEDTGLPQRIRTVTADQLYTYSADLPPEELALAWNDPYCIFYTSGTTGPAKGAVVTQHYLLTGAHTIALASKFVAGDVLYGAMPLFHFGGSVGHVLAGLTSGARVVLDSQFSVSAFWSRIRRHSVTVFIGVGPMVMMVYSLPEDDSDATSSLRLMLAAPIPPALHEQIEQRYNCRVRGVYGMTELFPLCVQHFDDPTSPGSAGRPNPGFDLLVVDGDDRPVASGEPGEIVARPRAPHVMFEGYDNRAEDTLRSLRNLWFHTGDLARMGDNGELYFVDRKKDAIRRRGENISSFQVEAFVNAHPAVAESAAHAVPSEIGEDEVKVCVVPAPGAELSCEELHAYCAESMPRFMVPRYIEILDTLPKTMTGRVRKVELRENALGPNTWDAARLNSN